MRLIAFTAMLFMWGSALSATVYKWVDADGVTHYSDQPHPGAVKMEVGSVQTYSAPAVSQPNPTTRARPRAQEGPIYAACELSRPASEEVYFNVSTLTARLRLDPQLRAGDKASVTLDGARLDIPYINGEFTVTPVFRGTHTMTAVVEDLAGNVVCQTPSVTFHVRQASMLSPQSPTRPRPPARP